MLYKIKDYRLTSLPNQVVVVGGRCILETVSILSTHMTSQLAFDVEVCNTYVLS